jgi:hypothetical protein
MIEQVGRILDGAPDEDVRGFAYQFLALHNDRLSGEVHRILNDRLKMERDSFGCNLIVAALVNAPEPMRRAALEQVHARFAAEHDPEHQRNHLAQIATLAKTEAIPLLKKHSQGESLLAQDARDYLAALGRGDVEPHAFFHLKALRDARSHAASCADPSHHHDEPGMSWIFPSATLGTNSPGSAIGR